MTSSLVGSEMCIRDSHSVTYIPRRPHPGGRTSHTARPKSAGGIDELSAVSYTHLTLPTICSV
eukprot:4957679-Prorocentrum_lima.AAC.1